MARLVTCFCFAAVISLVLGSTTLSPSATITPSSSRADTTTPTPTPTPTSMTTSTSSVMTPTPTPTPLPPPKLPPNNTYVLMEKNNDTLVCLKFVTGIALEFNYSIPGGKMNKTMFDFENNTKIASESFCDNKKKQAYLVLDYAPKGESKGYFVLINITGSTSDDNPTWTVSHMAVNFTFNSTDFPKYNGTLADNSEVTTYTNQTLLDESSSSVEYTRSFRCAALNNITGFSPFTTNHSINLTLAVDDLQVQAFEFRNATSGEFDNARVCLADNANAGNKVVPIAVGAALAGLVIVVLIAYLIGRLRNRRKSSYEALS